MNVLVVDRANLLQRVSSRLAFDNKEFVTQRESSLHSESMGGTRLPSGMSGIGAMLCTFTKET